MKDKTERGSGPAKAGQPLVGAAVKIENERANFKSLLLANPNHFGNMPELGFPAVKALSQKTTYEELTCIGLHPEGNRLQAIVNVNRSSGYGGGTCSDGSIEYVRFFVRRPAGWHDLGVATFTSHDLPGSPLPVSYSVEMAMDEARKYCTVENTVEVRGILSWNLEPPAGNSGWIPPWGNVLDVKVQIAPRTLTGLSIATLVHDKLISIDPSILKTVDLQETIKSTAEAPELPYATLQAKYRGKDVPGHRYGYTQAQKLIDKPLTATLLARMAAPKSGTKGLAEALPPLGTIADLVPDLSGIFGNLVKTNGDTTYEQLDCVGYNPETRMLSGVITVKKNSGYSGDLCDPGSTEYVSFWAHFDGGWQPLGTAQVRVHDLAAVAPGNPVRYAVFRGVNVPERLCGEITGMPLRAILSWQTPPTGPDFRPVWGNVVNTHIQPVITNEPLGDQRVRLMRINRVTITSIDGSGFAQSSSIAGDCPNGNNSPFGGPLYIEGDLTVESDAFFDPATGAILPGQHPPAYQVFVHKVGSPADPTQLTNSFNIAVFPVNPPAAHPAVTVTQAIQPFGGGQYYLYREGVVQAVNPRTLAVWEASGVEEGAYDIEVTGFVWNGVTYVPMATPSQIQRVYVYNGYPHTELDANGNTFMIKRPQLELSVDPPVGDCGDVKVGDTVTGKYRVKDNFFGSLSIGVVPITIGGVPQLINPVIPSGPTLYPDAGTNGTSGTWSLSTKIPKEMSPCGYTIVLAASDRALVGDSCQGHYNQVGVGFCLRKP